MVETEQSRMDGGENRIETQQAIAFRSIPRRFICNVPNVHKDWTLSFLAKFLPDNSFWSFSLIENESGKFLETNSSSSSNDGEVGEEHAHFGIQQKTMLALELLASPKQHRIKQNDP